MKLRYFDVYAPRPSVWKSIHREEVTYSRQRIGTAIIGEMADIKPIYKSIWRQRGWRKTNFFWSAYREPQMFSDDPERIYAVVIHDDGEFYILNANGVARALLEGNLEQRIPYCVKSMRNFLYAL